MKILIIEDDINLQRVLKNGLEQNNYEITIASDGYQGIDKFYDSSYNLIILDLNLPNLSGMKVLEEIRSNDTKIPILILSAIADIDTKVKGLDDGANDYLTKPFHFEELLARIKMLLRLKFEVTSNEVKINDLVINKDLKKVTKNNEIINLTSIEYRILEYLIDNKSKIIPKYDLINEIWGDDNIDIEKRFKVHLTHLRKKIGNYIIKNRKNEGYYVE